MVCAHGSLGASPSSVGLLLGWILEHPIFLLFPPYSEWLSRGPVLGTIYRCEKRNLVLPSVLRVWTRVGVSGPQ